MYFNVVLHDKAVTVVGEEVVEFAGLECVDGLVEQAVVLGGDIGGALEGVCVREVDGVETEGGAEP